MPDSLAFAVDVFRCVGERLATKAAELAWLVETAYPYEEWLNWEAFLACKLRETGYPFCEVTAKPTYASEGTVDDGERGWGSGDLRVGGPNDGADHCWVFAEFALVHDGNRINGRWREGVEADAEKLRRLGWVRSAALLIVAVASRTDVPTEWAEDPARCAVWNGPPLTVPFVIPLPGGGAVVLHAFDVKRDPAHTLTLAGR